MDVTLYVIEPIVQGDFFVCRWLHSIIHPINRQAHECIEKQLLFSVFMQNHMCVRLSVCKCTLCLNDIEGVVLLGFSIHLLTYLEHHINHINMSTETADLSVSVIIPQTSFFIYSGFQLQMFPSSHRLSVCSSSFSLFPSLNLKTGFYVNMTLVNELFFPLLS